MKKTFVLGTLFLLTTACADVPVLTQEKFNAVKNGMTLEQVKETLEPDYFADRCFEDGDADPDLVKENQTRYVCRGDGIRTYTVTFTFERGRLVRKFSNGRLNYREYD